MRGLRRQLKRLRRKPCRTLTRDRTFIPDYFKGFECLVRLPPAAANNGHTALQPHRYAIRQTRRTFRLHDEDIQNARQRLDLIDIGTDDLAAEYRTLLEHGVAHTGNRYIDAEQRLTVTTFGLSMPPMDLPMIV